MPMCVLLLEGTVWLINRFDLSWMRIQNKTKTTPISEQYAQYLRFHLCWFFLLAENGAKDKLEDNNQFCTQFISSSLCIYSVAIQLLFTLFSSLLCWIPYLFTWYSSNTSNNIYAVFESTNASLFLLLTIWKKSDSIQNHIKIHC